MTDGVAPLFVRLLTRSDAAEFQALRLRALRDNPEAFGSTYAQEEHTPLETIATRLGDGDDASTNIVLGVADEPDGPLLGLAGCYRESAVNVAARTLYVGRGFVPYAVEPRALAQGGRYYDLEYLWLRLAEHT